MKVLCLVALFVALSYTQIIGGQEPKILLDDFGLGNGEAIVDYDGTVFDNDIQQGVLVLLDDNIDVPETDFNAHIVGVNSYTPTDASTQFVFDTNALTGCTSLIGCVRDMEIRVWNGLSGRTFSSNIFDSTADFLQQYQGADFQGEWTVASPKSSNSLYTLQYDGNKGLDLTTSGLGGVDITAGGDSRSFAFFVIIDLESVFTIEIYRFSTGGLCSADTTVQPILAGQGEYTLQQTIVVVDFGQFTGDCSFTDVGAIQLKLPSDDAVDAIIRRFSVFGVPSSPSPSQSRTPAPTQSRTPAPTQSRTPAPTQSRTPAPSQSRTPAPTLSNTRTPAPSQSRTPAPSLSNTRTPAPSQSRTPAPSPTRTPTGTPSRSGPCIVFCQCASFTCALAFDNDDNFNDVIRLSDLNRNNFYFDDEDGLGDDDDNNGGYIVINLNDDDDDVDGSDDIDVPNVQNGDDDDDDNNFGGSSGNNGLSTSNTNVIVVGQDDEDDNGSNGSTGPAQVVYVPVNVPVNIPVPVPVPGPTVEVPVIQIVEVPVPVAGGDDDDNSDGGSNGPIIINPPGDEDDDEIVIPAATFSAADDDDNDDDDDNSGSSPASTLVVSFALIALALF